MDSALFFWRLSSQCSLDKKCLKSVGLLSQDWASNGCSGVAVEIALLLR